MMDCDLPIAAAVVERKTVTSACAPAHRIEGEPSGPVPGRHNKSRDCVGLQPVIEEAKFSKVPPWVPLIGQQVIEAVHGGWLDRLHCRTGFCGFAGTSREPSCKYPEQDLALSQGDGRVIRLAMLVLLKSSTACLMQGMQEGLPEALEVGLAWLRSKTAAVASVSDADCLVQLFLDQDDQLMECLLSELLLHLHKPSVWTATAPIADPHRMFLKFLGSMGNDHVTLIDFLTSQETCALLYFVRYLKLLLSDWDNFVKCHSELSVSKHDTSGQEMAAHLDLTMATLVRTRLKLEKMTQKHNLLPFNATPLAVVSLADEDIVAAVAGTQDAQADSSSGDEDRLDEAAATRAYSAAEVAAAFGSIRRFCGDMA
ncbi:hypothetical protein HPB52_011627 [Rhipicephalus sanguineus]|uniref:Protein Lines N-terminal domain-containing protein n=1 Tax=Rhipicephalus sanguineus TaxID=34632 RepID=A0A9D4SWK6_RHISA|nr:hypothetical protein HPB52_011627 [Rhipicephalus sanguineus]